MIASPVVPARIRRLINVESGLNDGIATPFVSVALAGAATGGQIAGHGPAAAVAELAVGVIVGVAAGGAGGLLVNAARKRGWVAEGFAGSAVLALAVCAYASAVAVHGNGFIAAFVGGLAFGTTGGRRGEPLVPFVEETGALVSLLVWLAFGAVALVPAMKMPDLADRPVRHPQPHRGPDGAGRGRARRDTARPGDGLPGGLVRSPRPGVGGIRAARPGGTGHPTAGHAVAVITITVLLSVVLHGVTAEPLAARYARQLARRTADQAGAQMPDMPERRLIRRNSPPQG